MQDGNREFVILDVQREHRLAAGDGLQGDGERCLWWWCPPCSERAEDGQRKLLVVREMLLALSSVMTDSERNILLDGFDLTCCSVE